MLREEAQRMLDDVGLKETWRLGRGTRRRGVEEESCARRGLGEEVWYAQGVNSVG